MRNFISDLLFILGEKKNHLPIIFILFFILSLIEVLSISILAPYISLVDDPEKLPIYLSKNFFFQKYIYEISHQKLFFLIGIFLIFIFCIKTLLFIFISKKILTFTWSVQLYLREKLVKKYQYLNYQIFVKKNSSELVTKLLRLIGVFNGRVMQHSLKLCSEFIILFAIFCLLFYTNYKILILLLFFSLILGIAYFYIFKNKMYKYGNLSNLSSKNALKTLNDIFSSLKEIRILKKEKYFRDLFISESKKLADYSIKSTLITISPRLIIEFIIIFIIILTTIVYVFFGEAFYKTEDLIIYAISAIRVIPSLNVIITSISHIRFGKSTLNDLKKEFQSYGQETIINSDVNKMINSNTEIDSLKLSNINFSFDNKIIFENAEINLSKGKLFGISGESGSGKSTLINIILGFYKSDSSKLFINNQEISILNWPQYLFFYVPQDFYIFDNDMQFNITLSDKFDEKRFKNSLKSAQILELFESLDYEISSNIGEKGSKISGGEKQRIAIARAFYHNREVIIFDESTSGLDEKNEKEILEILKKLSKNKIILIISHKTDLLNKYCDTHYKLINKKIIIND